MMNDKCHEQSYDERYDEVMRNRDFVNFILAFIAVFSAWIGFHFFDWSFVGTGLLIMLGIVMLAIGGFNHFRYNKHLETQS